MLSPNNDEILVDHSLSDDHGRGYFGFLLICHESPLLAIKYQEYCRSRSMPSIAVTSQLHSRETVTSQSRYRKLFIGIWSICQAGRSLWVGHRSPELLVLLEVSVVSRGS